VAKETFGETEDGQPECARPIVCDTPGMSMDPMEHTEQHTIMMDDTWKYIARHIPDGAVEKISPQLVFRADKVTEAYKEKNSR